MPPPPSKRPNPWEQNHFAMLVEHFGVDRVAEVLEYEPREVLGRAKRNASLSSDETRMLNPLIRKLLDETKAEKARREGEEALKRDYLAIEASSYQADKRSLEILVGCVTNELIRLSKQAVVLQWYASLDGRVWWKVVIDGTRIDGDNFRIPHPSQIKIGDALREGIEVILDEVGMDMTTLRYSSDLVHEIIEGLPQEHLTFAIEAYRELEEGKTVPIPEGLQAWVESDPEFVWEMPED